MLVEEHRRVRVSNVVDEHVDEVGQDVHVRRGAIAAVEHRHEGGQDAPLGQLLAAGRRPMRTGVKEHDGYEDAFEVVLQ